MFDERYTKELANELAHRSFPRVIVETGVLVLIALTALVGNSCVLYVFYKTPRLRSVTSYYIITLAISDIVMSLTGITTSIAVLATGRNVFGEKTAGQVIGNTVFSLIYGSILTTTLISINRYFCVAKPNIYKRIFKPRRAKITIIAFWVAIACIVAGSQLLGIGDGFKFFPGMAMFFSNYPDPTMASLTSVLTSFFFVIFPLALAILCYYKIRKIVKVHVASVSSTLSSNTNGISLSKEEVHVTMSVLAVVCAFSLCWVPPVLIFNLYVFYNVPRNVLMIVIFAGYFSSALNPMIYNIFNRPFRKTFLEVFCFPKNASRVSNLTAANRVVLRTGHNVWQESMGQIDVKKERQNIQEGFKGGRAFTLSATA